MAASKKILLEPFEELQCRGNHAHLQMHGEGQNLSACQVWTWDEANRDAYSIRLTLIQESPVGIPHRQYTSQSWTRG